MELGNTEDYRCEDKSTTIEGEYILIRRLRSPHILPNPKTGKSSSQPGSEPHDHPNTFLVCAEEGSNWFGEETKKAISCGVFGVEDTGEITGSLQIHPELVDKCDVIVIALVVFKEQVLVRLLIG